MKVKFNKELLLKHRFWIMLGVAALMILGGIFYLELIYAGPEDTLKNLDASYKQSEKYKGSASPAMIEDMRKRASESIRQQETVWQKAYAEQAEYFTFPPAVEKQFDFANGYFALDVKLSKGGDSKTWPEDKKDTLHGTIKDVKPDYFVLTTRKGDVKFNLTDTAMKVTVTEDNKQAQWLEVKNVYAKDRMATVLFQKGRYFNDLLTATPDGEQAKFIESYKDQIHEILKIVDPLDEKMNGVVQLRDWLYRPAPDYPPETAKFIRYVTADWETARN